MNDLRGLPNYKRYPVVGFPMYVVVWIDSHEPSGERNAEVGRHEFPAALEITYVGMIVDETETEIIFASGYKPTNKDFDFVIAIPKVAIRSRRRIYLKNQPVTAEE